MNTLRRKIGHVSLLSPASIIDCVTHIQSLIVITFGSVAQEEAALFTQVLRPCYPPHHRCVLLFNNSVVSLW